MDLTTHKDELFESFSLFSLLLIVLVVFATSISTGSPLLFVIIAFTPTIVTIVASLILYEESKFSTIIPWIIPIVLAGAFFFTVSKLTILQLNMEIAVITLINIIMSLLYLGIAYSLLRLLTIMKTKN